MENVQSDTRLKKASTLGWIICSLGAVFYCYEYVLRILPSVMVPDLMRHFHVSAQQLSAVVSLFYLAYTPMQAVVGVMTDLYGPRYILTFGVFVCALGSFFFGISDNLYLASIGRFLVGLGSAFAFVSALKLASVWLPLNRFALFAGLVTALAMLGGIAGDIGLTHVVINFGWKKTIYAGTILGVILLPIIWFVIRDKKDNLKNHRTLSRQAYKDTLSGLWVIVRNPQVWVAGLVGCILYMSLSVFAELWGIPFLKAVYNLNPNQAAFANSMVFFGWLVGAPLTGWISDKLRMRRIPLLLGCVFSAVTIFWIIWFPETPLYIVNFLLFLFGVFSSIEVVCFAVGREICPRHVSGAAVSFVNLLVMVGGVAFQPLVGKFLDMHWSGVISQGVRVYSAFNFQMALTVIPVSILLGVVLCAIMRESFDAKLDKE